MKKIIIFNPGFFIYGAERGLLNLIKALGGEFEVTVVLSKKSPLEEKLKGLSAGINIKNFPLPVLKFSFSPFYYISFIFFSIINVVYFAFYVISRKIDIICSNSLILTFPVFLAKITGKKSVWFIREFFEQKLLNKALGGYAEKFSDKIICQSKTIKEEMLLANGAEVVYEPLDSDNYKVYDYSKARKNLGLPRDSAVISLIGRLHPSKGQYEFIRALKGVLKNSGNLAVAVAGDISVNNLRSRLYKKKIKKIISGEGLKNIFFLGYVEDISEVICASDICVFPFKRKEPFGIAAAEALAFGKEAFFPLEGGPAEVQQIFKAGSELDMAEITRIAFNSNFRVKNEPRKLYIPEDLSFPAYQAKIKRLLDFTPIN